MVSQNNNADGANEKTKRNGGAFMGRLFRDFFLGCVAFIPLALLTFITYHFFHLLLTIGRVFFGITASRATSAGLLALVIAILIYTGRKLRLQEKWLLSFVEQAISKIPLLGSWYAALRDMVQALTAGGGDKGYLGTVAVSLGEGYMIGFITKKEIDCYGRAGVTVFVPTSPNPTTGLVLFYPEDAVRPLDISPDQAFAKIISLGLK